jgi:outer membrane protein assembly factor BamD
MYWPKRFGLAIMLSAALFTSCVRKKYETPITKNTQQPDKVLFDSAMRDIEHGRYEIARISLQTLMNTYESSEFLAKAKLAVADSWFREGGGNGLAQAEAEYKDFILFYPGMEESAQAQDRVCDIHYKQMDKSDRDVLQTLRAEDECKALIVQFPNSKFVPDAMQKLRNIQESLAAHEMAAGSFYWSKQMNPAAANRLNALVDQYPLFSKAGEALYEAGDAYSKMGPRFRKQAGEMFARIVSDYPLSPRVKDATKRLEEMELPVPAVNQQALARAKWEQENYKKPSMLAKSMGLIKGGPDVQHAARSGQPTMTDPKRTMPASIPIVNNEATVASTTPGTGTTDVSVSNTSNALDTKPDARTAAAGSTTAAATTTPAPVAPLPTNRDAEMKKYQAMQAKKQAKLEKKKKKSNEQKDTSAPATPAAAAPASTTDTPAKPPQ